MITKEYIENYFKHHDRLVVYRRQIPLTITKAWHLHLSGGHADFDVADSADLAEMFAKTGVTLKPVADDRE